MKTTIKLDVPKELAQNILVLAVEDGSTYWAEFSKIRKSVDKNTYTSVMVHNYGDEVEEQSPAKSIKIIDIQEAIRRLIERDFTSTKGYAIPHIDHSRNLYESVITNDSCNLDQGDADIVLQCAVFGHIIYG